MDMIIIMVLILIVVIVFLLLQNNGTISIKSKALKKDEIILKYENELKDILLKNQDDKSQQVKQKKLFLQKCSSEFARNIFFTEDESKQIIQRFAKL